MGQSNRHVSVLIFVRYVIRPVKRLELIHERVESLLCPDLDALLHPDSPVRSSLILLFFKPYTVHHSSTCPSDKITLHGVIKPLPLSTTASQDTVWVGIVGSDRGLRYSFAR